MTNARLKEYAFKVVPRQDEFDIRIYLQLQLMDESTADVEFDLDTQSAAQFTMKLANAVEKASQMKGVKGPLEGLFDGH